MTAPDADVEFAWRGPFANDEVNALHAEAFEHRLFDDDSLSELERHSVGWVTARDDDGRVRMVARRLRRPPQGLLPRRLRLRADQRRPDAVGAARLDSLSC